MLQLFINFLLNILMTVVQIIVWPINQLLSNFLPSISNQINSVTNVLNTVFDSLAWALGVIPTPIISVLTFIIVVEIAKHTIFLTSHVILRLWNVIQKVKFW